MSLQGDWICVWLWNFQIELENLQPLCWLLKADVSSSFYLSRRWIWKIKIKKSSKYFLKFLKLCNIPFLPSQMLKLLKWTVFQEEKIILYCRQTRLLKKMWFLWIWTKSSISSPQGSLERWPSCPESEIINYWSIFS